MCRNRRLKRPLYLISLLIEKPQEGHKGPSKNLSFELQRLPLFWMVFLRVLKMLLSKNYVISEANTYFRELNLE